MVLGPLDTFINTIMWVDIKRVEMWRCLRRKDPTRVIRIASSESECGALLDFLHSWIPDHALCFFHLLQSFASVNTSVYSCGGEREKLLCHILSALDFIACVLIINYKHIHKTGLETISLGNELIRQTWQLEFYYQKTDFKKKAGHRSKYI